MTAWLELDDVAFEPGSFRDPSGRVLERSGRILRVLAPRTADDFAWVWDRGIVDALTASGQLVATAEIDPALVGLDRPHVHRVLEHARIDFLSYPYEWCFSGLQAAALLQIDLHLDLLARGATLIDASAYNIQFQGTRPIFIDILSLRRYREGEIWSAHLQFCQQFLNPLLLQAARGVAFNRWYRGAMEGIPVADLAAILSFWDKCSWRVLLHIVAQARLQRAAASGRLSAPRPRPLPKAALIALLRGLRTWVAALKPRLSNITGWTTYAATHTYAAEEQLAKRRFVADFIQADPPRRLLDLGCNTGDYAALALAEGTQEVVGLEADPAAADHAFQRASREGLNFLPLVVDAADPSPAHGWRGTERQSLSERASFDALIGLAFEHHLAITRNVPLDEIIAWLTTLAARGVVEFVPKHDPTIQSMLASREDIFHEYSVELFAALLGRRARIVRQETISASGRTLFWFDRGRR
jgi:ribosomal protein L11 methylase PrmA